MNIDLLIIAVCGHDYKVIERLIEQGIDINARFKTGNTALIQASLDHDPHLVKIILDHGADPNIKTGNLGLSALHWASDRGCIENIKLLLSYGG